MTRPAFNILDVNHTGFTVRDLDASLAFWRDALGFRELYRARRAGTFAAQVTGVADAEIEIAMLLAPGHKIELVHYLSPAAREGEPARPCDRGAMHLAFDVDDLDAALAALASRGWAAPGTPQVIDGGPRNGTRTCYVRDPDGTTIELMQPPRV